MTDTIPRPQPKDVDTTPAKEKPEAPELVLGLTLAESRVAFQQDRERPAEGLPALKIEGKEKERAQYLQDTLADMVSMYAQKPEEVRKALEKEKKDGVFGPASQKAFQDYLKFLDTKILLTIKEWDAIKPTEALPPGCPIGLPKDKFQRMATPELFRSLASADEVSLDWKWDTKKVPTDEQLDKLDTAFDWLAKCNRSIVDAQNEFKDRTLGELVKEYGLPEAWQRKPGDNPEAWRASVAEMIDLSVRTRNYVAAMQSLYKSSKDNDFPLALPPNTKLSLEVDGKRVEVTDKNLYTAESRAAMKDGVLKDVTLALPTDLRQEDPANKQKIENMRSWLGKYGDKIDQALSELAKLQANPDSVIMFGDQELQGCKGRFNAKGELVGIVDPKRYSAKPGEELRDVNLLGYDFNVEKITEGPDKGKFKISQTIQAENAPWYAYLNIRALGVDKVGKPMPVENKVVGADDFVWVKNGDKVEMVKASNLESFKKMQQVMYYGEKGLVATMDAAMLVSGTIELGAAIKGARIAATAAEAGLRLTGRQAAKEIGLATTRIVVAGAGIANNAGARDTEVGRFINNARTAYFIGDIGLNLAAETWRLGRGAVNLARGAESTPGALSAGEKIHTIIHGGKLADGKVIQGLPWIKQVHTGTSIAFRTTEAGFGYLVYKDLQHGWDDLKHPEKKNARRDALLAVGDGRGLQVSEKDAFDTKDKQVLAATSAVLDGYGKGLSDGRTPQTQQKIKEILDNTKKYLGADANDADKKKFVQILASDVRLNAGDKDTQAASRIALLYLSRDKNGAVPSDLGDPQLRLKAVDVVNKMKSDLAVSKQGSRELVTGDCLVRLGAITHQNYGAVLQNVLSNPESTRSERLNALTDAFGARMATVVDGLRYQEKAPADDASGVDKERETGRKFGLTSIDLLQTLKRTAQQDKDPDVRALAASLVYGLSEKDVDHRSELLQKFNKTAQTLSEKPGAFAKAMNDALSAAAKIEIDPNDKNADVARERKLSAILSLSLLSDTNNAEQQKAIAKSIAECASPTNAAQTLAVLDALMPARLEQLSKDDAKAANDLRVAALELVKKPSSPEEEDGVVKVLRRMEPLLRSGEQGNKVELARRLQDMLSASAANKSYAGAYPALRAAAIDTLAALGHQGSLDIIRSHVAAPAESSAVVRTAAVKALEELKDPTLRKIVNDLIEKETDPSAAARLRDVKFATQRVEPGSDEYSRLYQAALKDVIGDLTKHKHLDGFGSNEQLNWLRQNFDLLDIDKFRDRCNDVAKNAMSGWDRFWSLAATEELAEQTKVFEVQDQRWKQWQDLCKMAKGSGAEADKAKLALFYVLTHNGHPMGGDSGLSIQIDGDKYHRKLYNFDWKEFSARSLKDAAETGCGSRDITAYCIRQGLREGNIPFWVNLTLLDGLRKLNAPSKDGYQISREQIAKITAEALETELRRKHEDQNDVYQQELLKDLQKYRHRMVFPVLEAMGDKSKFEAVRKTAKSILDDFRNNVGIMWEETVPDQTATAQQRAERAKKALDDANNAEVAVQELFKAYKGYKLENAADPGIAYLQQAMNDRNDRTRKAAAKILLESGLPAGHPAKVRAAELMK